MGKAIRNFKRGIQSDDEDVTPPAADPNKQVASRSSASEMKSPEVEVERKT
jgi:hypothetical protein